MVRAIKQRRRHHHRLQGGPLLGQLLEQQQLDRQDTHRDRNHHRPHQSHQRYRLPSPRRCRQPLRGQRLVRHRHRDSRRRARHAGRAHGVGVEPEPQRVLDGAGGQWRIHHRLRRPVPGLHPFDRSDLFRQPTPPLGVLGPTEPERPTPTPPPQPRSAASPTTPPTKVQVRAANSVGESTWSTATKATPTAQKPDPPAAATLTHGNTSLTVSWSAPANNGASISDYDVQYRACTLSTDLTCSDSNTATWGAWTNRSGETTSDTSRSVTLSSLTNGTAYQVQVRAANNVGESEWSHIRRRVPVHRARQTRRPNPHRQRRSPRRFLVGAFERRRRGDHRLQGGTLLGRLQQRRQLDGEDSHHHRHDHRPHESDQRRRLPSPCRRRQPFRGQRLVRHSYQDPR